MISVKVVVLCFVVLGVVAGSARAANPVVVVETSAGSFKIELFEDKAPVTVKNFLQYVEDKHYDGTIFHRVINDFMIQGGGFEAGMKEKKTRDPIKNESNNGLSNLKGTIAMARTREPNSASAQWYINVKDNTFLDKAKAQDGVGYCVFGRVIEGQDVIDKIKTVETDTVKGHENVPSKDIVIKSAKVVKEEKK
ncbi:Peptidyl-prolyl cis-trans isomerase cyp18 [Gemmata sp. SH-PL17]|uniref:Peptidyl-prolyl cis-trans isomerase n=1 Tax=Gemmata massiliana TaxID=1210884 RepID=A0A6P2D8P4_9BACT|nr:MULTISPECIES: peptidylprolyl isomerase [Gemmata]AMV24891.1 Peptidyl-prolyl cis-trans isomerase cyp18 [Gemmata sp. SH-PL17]VTR96524.1 peptidyl-prolyl cis-trans isomerase b : Peptidyl-prolyl cis-trans isomerase OS=Azoarcus sp. (strain BH72) GN=ppiA PE=3 SV=1: Pro_isomerase [Gemmata massiliana]